MTKYLGQILEITKQSGQFSQQELIDFTSALLCADDEDLLPLVKLIRHKPGSIRWIFQNLQSKQLVFKSQDKQAWEQILQQEAEWIESL